MNTPSVSPAQGNTPSTTATIGVFRSHLSASQLLKLLWCEAVLDVKSLLRSPGFMAPTLLFPAVFYLLFGVFLAKADAPLYMLVSYGCFGVMGPALFNFGMQVATDRESGFLIMRQLSPAPVAAYLVGKLSSSLLMGMLVTLLLFVLAALFGGVRMYTSQWLGLGLWLMLGSVPFCLLGLLLGLTLSAKAAPATVNLVYLPLALLGGLWLPMHLMPELMQQFALMLPSYHFAQVGYQLVGVSISGASAQPLWVHLAALGGFALLMVWAARAAYYKRQNVRR